MSDIQNTATNLIGKDAVLKLRQAHIVVVWEADTAQHTGCQRALSNCLAELTEAQADMGGEGMKAIKMTLDWPDRALSPNAPKRHWRSKQAAKVLAKNIGYCVACQECSDWDCDYIGDLALMLIFHPPSRRRMDLDNIFASMKPHLDGICEALSVDDSQIKRVVLEWAVVVKGGMVELSLAVLT